MEMTSPSCQLFISSEDVYQKDVFYGDTCLLYESSTSFWPSVLYTNIVEANLYLCLCIYVQIIFAQLSHCKLDSDQFDGLKNLAMFNLLDVKCKNSKKERRFL